MQLWLGGFGTPQLPPASPPMMMKIDVKGDGQLLLFQNLSSEV